MLHHRLESVSLQYFGFECADDFAGLVADSEGKPNDYSHTSKLPYLTLSYANGPSKYDGQTNLTGIDVGECAFLVKAN